MSYSVENLQTKLDRMLLWRKKELTTINQNIEISSGEVLEINIRSGIVFLYAHWEGFIKQAAREYLKFLNNQNLYCRDIIDNLHILHLKPTITEHGVAKKSTAHANIYNKIVNSPNEIFNVKPNEDNIISTDGNLKYSILENILFSLGLDKSQYALQKVRIDSELLYSRNNIAHGEHIGFTHKHQSEQKAKESFGELYSAMLALIETFKEQILDAAMHERYKKTLNP